MEIHPVSRKNINIEKWDHCVQQYGSGMPYAYSNYLDISTDSQWEALITADYEYIFPLPFTKKLGLKIYSQPVLCQQLGLIGPAPSSKLFSEFLAHIPADVQAVQLKFNEHNQLVTSDKNLKTRTNFILQLGAGYEPLLGHFSKSLKKRIRQSAAHYELKKINDVDLLIGFYETEMEARVKLGRSNYLKINRLLKWLLAEKKGSIYAAMSPENKMEACLFVAHNDQRIINLFGTSNEAGRNHFAMHFLLHEILKQYSNQQLLFDFEGSDLPGVKKFYESFGSINRPYLALNQEQFPKWYRSLAAIKKLFD